MRLKTDIKPKEATFQVVLDILAFTPFYRAFLITTDVPGIYIHEILREGTPLPKYIRKKVIQTHLPRRSMFKLLKVDANSREAKKDFIISHAIELRNNDCEEDDEVIKELYDDVNVKLGNDDTEMTVADQGASEQQNVSQESGIPNFTSVFKFEQRVSALESEMSELRQTNQFAEAISSILGIVDTYLASKMKEYGCSTANKQAHRRSSSRESRISQSGQQIDKADQDYHEDKNSYNALIEYTTPRQRHHSSHMVMFLLNRGLVDQPMMKTPSSGSVRDKKWKLVTFESSKDSRYATRSRVRMGDNDEQPADKEVTKVDWFKKLERPPTPDPDWSKR
ncbi:hypothetical protein Tco_0865314 [Tanacetum coccineum]